MDNKPIKIIDWIFIIIFGIMLFIPISKIDKSQKSNYENRYLETFPQLLTSRKTMNPTFGKELDDWFSSRFNFRYKLINFYKAVSCGFNVNYCLGENKVFDKRNHLLYTNSFFGIVDSSSQETKDSNKFMMAGNFKRLNDLCKSKGIKFYVLIIPRRADFLKYNVPVRKYKNSYDEAVNVIDYIKNNTDVDVIFPEKELHEANKLSPVYYKTDHHWSQYGAYTAYLALMQEIRKDFPDIHIEYLEKFSVLKSNKVKISSFGKFHPGTMVRTAGFPDYFVNNILDTDYLYFSNPKSKNIHYMKKSNLPYFDSKTDVYIENPYGKRKALIIGDSFTGNLLHFLPYSFKETAVYSVNYKTPYAYMIKEIIEKFKPDVVIINVRTFVLELFLRMYNVSK